MLCGTTFRGQGGGHPCLPGVRVIWEPGKEMGVRSDEVLLLPWVENCSLSGG